jgi:hypothetical protein
MAREILGVDIGGVIINRTKFNGIYYPILNSFWALRQLRERRFGDNVFVVSHADAKMERDIRMGLRAWDFYEMTGIKPQNVGFCREREYKATICALFHVTHFIDDRTEVLEHLLDVVPNLYLFQGMPEEIAPRKAVLSAVVQVTSWKEVIKKLLE